MKVLQIIDGTSFGGIAKLMLDIRNNISSDIKIDFLTQVPIYEENIKNVINIDSNRKTLIGKIRYNHRLFKLLKNDKYDIVHINSSVFLFSFQVSLICKMCGIKHIIAHSHSNTYVSKFRKIIIKVLTPIYNKMIKCKLSCSKSSASKLFIKTDDVIYVKNGINIDKFKYNKKIRDEYRKKYNVDDKIVYGTVGRIDRLKNHNFLIDLFYEIQNKETNAVLFVLGTGSLENKIKEKVKLLKIADKVKFLGFRDDVNNLLNMMDIFLFPSLSEGIGISLIEAQTSGLPAVVYKNIPKEANISNNFYILDSFNVNDWISKIKNIKFSKRESAYKCAIKNGYDIRKTSKQLEKIYNDLLLK